MIQSMVPVYDWSEHILALLFDLHLKLFNPSQLFYSQQPHLLSALLLTNSLVWGGLSSHILVRINVPTIDYSYRTFVKTRFQQMMIASTLCILIWFPVKKYFASTSKLQSVHVFAHDSPTFTFQMFILLTYFAVTIMIAWLNLRKS
jgi:hypothetical protein